ncbi:MAG: putative Ig domain-containing protein [Bryobacterales bacterium]|nr:putative Ig domain-containing protein [Bryobacterales bacterium]
MIRRTGCRFPQLLAVALLAAMAAPAQIRDNGGFKQNVVPRNDDGSSPLVPLGWNLNFFGRQRNTAYVNNNGNITFDSALSEYTPFGLTGVQREIIAVFFADVDTRPQGSNLVTYGQDTVNGRRAFGVNYLDVGYYNQHADLLNRFQMVLIERDDTGNGNFDIEFNYERIVWETGDASGGSGGRGGVSASVGWSNGSGQPGTYFELPGSLIPGSFLDGGPYSLARRRTVGSSATAGRWLFRARGGVLIPNLTITTGCPIPNGTAGRNYAHRFEAFGARPPYRWSLVNDPGTSLPGLTMNAGGILQGVPAAPGTYNFTAQVTSADEEGEVTVPQRCSITVDPPALSLLTNTALPSGRTGSRYEARLRVDGTTAPVRYSLFQSTLAPGLTLAQDGTISGTPMIAGTSQFQVMASPETAGSAVPAIKRFKITVEPNDLALRASCPLPNGTGNVSYRYQFQAQGGAPPYRFTAIGQVPTGLNLGADGVLQGLPTVPHWWPFTVRVEDTKGNSVEQGCGVVILFPEVRITTACPLPYGVAGGVYARGFQASGGSAPYAWMLEGTLPVGLRLSQDGSISGTPLQVGTSQFRVRVTDSRGQAASAPCSLGIIRGEFGISGCPITNAYAGEPYSHVFAATGGAEPYFYTALTALPPGLRFSPDGFLAGSVSTPGTYPISVRVTEATGRSTSVSCSLNVLPQVLRLDKPCEAPAAKLGEAFSYQLGVAGGAGPYTFAIRGAVPGLALTPADGRLSGTPTQAGVFPVGYSVTDRGGRVATAACRIAVTLPDLPDTQLTGMPATLNPASAGPTVQLELSKAFPVAVEGEAILEVTPETNNPNGGVNRDDPAVRFSNNQRRLPFTIAAGSRNASFGIVSTGTVASTVSVRVERLRAGGLEFVKLPAWVTGRVNRAVPSITNVCYAPTSSGFDVDISGFSTTRDLTLATLTFGSNMFRVDLTAAAAEYFSGDDSVRTGGTFRVRAPYRLTAGSAQTLGQGNAVIANSAGASASRPIARCQ